MLHSTDRFAPSRTLLVPLPLYLALLSACATGEELADSRGANPVSSAAQSETTTDASSGSDADAGSGEAGSLGVAGGARWSPRPARPGTR